MPTVLRHHPSKQYATTSLSPDRASPERLLDLWRGRWEIENRLFWVRDVAFREVHSGTAPLSMSHIKDDAIITFRALKAPNITAALRDNALKVADLFHKLGMTTKRVALEKPESFVDGVRCE